MVSEGVTGTQVSPEKRRDVSHTELKMYAKPTQGRGTKAQSRVPGERSAAKGELAVHAVSARRGQKRSFA